MKVKRIDIVRREDGLFHPEGKRKIRAVKHGKGYGVMVFFEGTPIDVDFGEAVWCPSADELRRIADLMDKSDHLTYELLGRGWEGKRPFHMLEEFM